MTNSIFTSVTHYLPFERSSIDIHDTALLGLVINSIKYILDVFKFLVDGLLNASESYTAQDSSITDPDSPPHLAGNPLISLILLSSWSRHFLRQNTRALRGFAQAISSPQYGLSPESIPAFERMASLVDSPPLKVDSCEKLLAAVDRFVQAAYQNAGMDVTARSEAERSMIIHGRVPEVLHGVMPRVLREVLPSIREEVNRLALFVGDYKWLGFRNDRESQAFRKKYWVDIQKRKVIKKVGEGGEGGKIVRKCVRCAEIADEITPPRAVPRPLMPVFSRCACDGNFLYVKMDEA